MPTRRSLLLGAFFALLAGQLGAAAAASSDVLIRNTRVISGVPGDEPREAVDVLVRGERIDAIGIGLDTAGARVIDGTGTTVIPGLIDLHTHLLSVPGAFVRGDSREELDAARLQTLRIYLAAGVTAVLDTAAGPSTLGGLRGHVRKTNLGPRIEGLSPFITPEGGYGTTFDTTTGSFDPIPPIGDDLELVDQLIEVARPLDPVGVKLTIENGFGPTPSLALFSKDQLTYIREATRRHDTRLFVHSMGQPEFELAMHVQPDVLVHPGLSDSPLTGDMLERIKASGASVISTLAIFDMVMLPYRKERLEEEWMVRLVPEKQRATVASDEMSEAMMNRVAELNSPWWVPAWVARLVAPYLFTESAWQEQLDYVSEGLRKMHEAGVNVVMGADMGNWPVFTVMLHGVGSIREMELLEAAGIARADVLTAATSRAAEVLGRGADLGTLAPGKYADLVVLESNPLEVGMKTLREPRYVMSNGEIRTPDGWLKD